MTTRYYLSQILQRATAPAQAQGAEVEEEASSEQYDSQGMHGAG